MAILPLLTFASLVIHCLQTAQRNGKEPSVLNAFNQGLCWWGLLAVAGAEVLSFYGFLTRSALAVYWSVILLTVLFLIFKNREWAFLSSARTKIQENFSGLSLFLKICTALTALMVLLVAAVAWISPPNTWDVMTYHLARIAHWQAGHSLANFATPELRQLAMPPGGEILMAHFYILTDGDLWTNLVQWFCLPACAAVSILIVRELKWGTRAEIFAALFALTLPIGIIQASSSKNDYIAGLWLLEVILFLLRYRSRRQSDDLIWMSLTLGLALLTKPSTLVFAPPFLAVVALQEVRYGPVAFMKSLFLVILLAGVLNLGHACRMVELLGLPWNADWTAKLPLLNFLKMQTVTLKTFLSNLTRNTASLLSAPFPMWNRFLTSAVTAFHSWIGQPIADPSTTFALNGYRVIFYQDEITATGFIHSLIFFAGIPLFLISRRAPLRSAVSLYALACLADYLVFCLMIKYSPFHSRTLLPLFLIFSPVAGYFLANGCRATLANLLLLLMVLGGLHVALANKSRPLLGPDSILKSSRRELYFTSSKGIGGDFSAFERLVEPLSLKSVGLVLDSDHWEYPFWVILKRTQKHPRIEAMDVSNISSVYEHPGFDPDMVVISRRDPGLIQGFASHYNHHADLPRFSVYVKGKAFADT